MSIAHSAKSEFCRLLDGAGNTIGSTAGALDVAIAGTGMTVTQSTHNSLNCNANMQINNADLVFGQAAMASSLPVAIASDQGSLTVDSVAFDIRALTPADVVTVTATALDVRPMTSADVVTAECKHPEASGILWNGAAPTVGTSSASLDTRYCSKIAVFGNCGTDTPTLTLEASNDDATWYDTFHQIYPDGASNDFYLETTGWAARYMRVKTDATLASITLAAAAKH